MSNSYFAFLIDKIDNIITYSLYSLYYVTRTSTNGSADTDMETSDSDTALQLVEVLVT